MGNKVWLEVATSSRMVLVILERKIMRKALPVLSILMVFACTACTISSSNSPNLEPAKPSVTTKFKSGDIEFRFEGLTPESPKSVQFQEKIQVRFSFRNPFGTPFLVWARPYSGPNGGTQGGCHEPSSVMEGTEGTFTRFVLVCQTPHDEFITAIQLEAVSVDQKVRFFEGIVSNVSFRILAKTSM
jgi:hypothetical protein